MRKLTESDEYDIRYSNSSDTKKLSEWLKWPGVSKAFPYESEEERNLFVMNWAAFYRYKCTLTATYKGSPVGMAILFLMPYRKVSKHAMLSVIVEPALQRKGIGRSLVRNINHLGQTRFQLHRIYFDVYGDQGVQSFFSSCGYNLVCSQKKYVKEAENVYLDRHLMELRFPKNVEEQEK